MPMKTIPFVILALFATGSMIGTILTVVNGIADTTYAVCPPVDEEGKECGRIIYPPNPYDYEYGTKEFWNAYCNAVLGTKFECK